MRALPGHSQKVNSVALSSDGKRAISGSQDSLVMIWDTDTGSEVCCFVGVRCGWLLDGSDLLRFRTCFGLYVVCGEDDFGNVHTATGHSGDTLRTHSRGGHSSVRCIGC